MSAPPVRHAWRPDAQESPAAPWLAPPPRTNTAGSCRRLVVADGPARQRAAAGDRHRLGSLDTGGAERLTTATTSRGGRRAAPGVGAALPDGRLRPGSSVFVGRTRCDACPLRRPPGGGASPQGARQGAADEVGRPSPLRRWAAKNQPRVGDLPEGVAIVPAERAEARPATGRAAIPTMTTLALPLGASAGEGADADGDMLRQMLRCRADRPRPACRTGLTLAAAERLDATPD